MSSDDTVAAVKSLPVHVHRAALALGRSRFTAEEFRKNRANCGTEHDGESVTSVRGDQGVVFGQRQFDAHSHGFLDHARGNMRSFARTDLNMLIQEKLSRDHLST